MKKNKFISLIALVFISNIPVWSVGKKAEPIPLYKDKTVSVDVRVEDLLKRMTLKEKINQMQNRATGRIDEIDKIFDKESYGCTHEMSMDAQSCANILYDLQKYMLNNTRLGIPIITAAEGIEGILQNGCTIFPHALAQGSTFNPELLERMTAACASEAKVMGIKQVLSPVLDIARDLRWGRIEETYGEDPFLIATMGIAFVNGYQKNGVNCMPKHFVAHGSPTGGLNCAYVSGGERELRSLYLYPFKKVIQVTQPQAIMSAYSAYDGVATSGSSYYMTDILRGELGFNGYVYSDWGSVGRLKTFHFSVGTDAEAAQMSVEAGIDINVDNAFQYLEELVKSGKMDEKYIDIAVRRILRVKFALGLFDNPYGDPKSVSKVVRSAANVSISKEVADESAILLKNTNNILPLDITKYKKIAVLGPNSNQTVFGDYSWTGPDTKEGVTLLAGLTNALKDKVEILHAEGCDWWSKKTDNISQAVELAKQSDIAIVAVGTRSTFLGRSPRYSTAGEGFDISSLEFPGEQEALLKAVKATGKPLVVVFIAGKPLAMPWVKDNADAVLVQWYAGEQQGTTLADILLGKVNPSGKLNVSFPRSTGNTPCYYNYYPTDREQIFDAGGSYDEPKGHYIFEKPYAIWNFGYGLSYTNFKYSNCQFNDTVFNPYGILRVSVDVENTGKMDGKEVVQLYIRDLISSVATPIQQLKAFNKVLIKSGEKQQVTLEVPLRELALFNARMQEVVEPGDFEIQIGNSSDNILFKKRIKVK